MSRGPLQALPVIEWSPAGATAFDPQTKQYHRGPVNTFAAELSGKDVILVIGRRSAFVRAVRMPDAPRAEIGQILAMQIGQYFPVPASDLAYDFRVTADKNEEGRLIVVGAVRTDLLRIAMSDLRGAGLRAKVIVPASFGSWLLSQALERQTCAVVEPTNEGLAIDVISDGELRYSRLAPLPSDSAGIEAEVERTFSVASVSGIEVVAAGGIAYPSATVKTASATLEAFAPAADRLGLSIELPEARVQREKKRQAQRVRLVAMLVLAGIGLWTFIYLDKSQQAAEADRVKRWWTARIKKEKDLTKAAEADAAREDRVAGALGLAFRPAQRFSDLMLVAGNVAPGTTWLTGMTLERGRPVTIRGTATTSEAVAAYLQRLSSQERFRDVRLVFANNAMIEDKPIVQFSISFHARGNLPLQERRKVASR